MGILTNKDLKRLEEILGFLYESVENYNYKVEDLYSEGNSILYKLDAMIVELEENDK